MSKVIYLNVYSPQGNLMAKVPDDEGYSAALLMSMYGKGSTIRSGKKILWLEGADGEGAESYDSCLEKVFARMVEIG